MACNVLMTNAINEGLTNTNIFASGASVVFNRVFDSVLRDTEMTALASLEIIQCVLGFVAAKLQKAN